MAVKHAHSHAHQHSGHAHGHSHAGHTHTHVAHAPQTFNVAFAVAGGLNLLFTIVEAVYAVIAHSMGLLADAGHNLGDVLGIAMAWGSMLLLKRAATARYSYGYKKTTILSALANALLLVFTSAIILYESINKLLHPVMIQEIVVIIVALVGIGVNGGTALLFMRGRDKDLNIKSTFLHLAYDALISLGVVIAATIIYFTKWVWLDPLVGIAIVLMILSGTWSVLRSSVDLILGAVPHGIDQQAVRQYLSQLAGVQAVHDLHIWGLSTQETALTAHLVVPGKMFTDADYVEINHILLHDFKINHVTIQIETGSATNPCGQAVTC
jgi:cobalt-zinc-cadmium efflux system protein